MPHTMTLKKIHVAIIPDGNRRWAKQHVLQPWQGHTEGVAAFRRLVDWAYNDARVGTMTIWGFSTDNWSRDSQEITQLMRLYEQFLADERPTFHEKQTRLVHAGRTDRIPASLAELLAAVAAETADYQQFTLQLALDYGGRDEMIRAATKLVRSGATDPEALATYIDNPTLPDIDIVLRTSGEMRLSNFFLWQAAYAELFFIDTYFPDLTPKQLDGVITEFSARHRRFGT